MHGDHQEASLRRGMRYAERLVRTAKRERDRRSYRENLGYDQEGKLTDFISTLPDLTYQDQGTILAAFYAECATIQEERL